MLANTDTLRKNAISETGELLGAEDGSLCRKRVQSAKRNRVFVKNSVSVARFLDMNRSYKVPFVESTPLTRSSILVEISRAFATALKIASMIWWRLVP